MANSDALFDTTTTFSGCCATPSHLQGLSADASSRHGQLAQPPPRSHPGLQPRRHARETCQREQMAHEVLRGGSPDPLERVSGASPTANVQQRRGVAYLGPTGGPSGPLPIVVEASWLPEEEKARARDEVFRKRPSTGGSS